jgi:hypothetical protein
MTASRAQHRIRDANGGGRRHRGGVAANAMIGVGADWPQFGTDVLGTDLANLNVELLADGFSYCCRRDRVGLNLEIVFHPAMHAIKLPSC